MSAHHNASGSLMHGEFMAFVGDEESLTVVRGWAERQGFPGTTVQSGGSQLFGQMLEQGAPPKFAIVDFDGQDDPAASAARLANQCGAECKLIALGSANDARLYRAMLAAGMVDYLVKPVTVEMLSQALALSLRGSKVGKSETKEAKIIVVVGVRGGVGASLITVNTGWLLAHELKCSCALLDLDLQYGTSSLALDLEPGHGLRDVVSSPQRVDSLMVASSMVAAGDKFSILSAEEPVEEVVSMDSSAIIALLKEMRNDFDFIIVDLPRHLMATQKRLLAAAHEIVLVTELSLAGIRDTLRIKNALTALGAAANLSLVATRMGAGRQGQIDAASFEKGAQMKISHTVPEDYKAVAEASNVGKALGTVAAQAAITKSLLELASKLSGKDRAGQKKKAGWWGKLAGGAPDQAKKAKEGG
jgi:pilus assembly protein CpaE